LETIYDTRANDDKEILQVLREEYNVIGVIKRTVQAKKGMYDGLSSVEYAPKSDLAIEYEHVVDIITSK
jgi:chromosome partitioning protein